MLLLCLYLVSSQVLPSLQDVVWNRDNCNMNSGRAVAGFVVDAICTRNLVGESGQAGNGCDTRTSEENCGGERCKWYPEAGHCKWNRDEVNNVCLHPPASEKTLPESVHHCARITNQLMYNQADV